MPLALDTEEVFRYVFSTDRNKENPPTLLFNYPTCREVRKFASLFDAADEAKTVGDAIEKRCEALRIILCGWENFGVAYDPAEVDAILSDMDYSELRARLIKDMSASELEKKASALRALSTSDNSAKGATESVQSQTAPSPTNSNALPVTEKGPTASPVPVLAFSRFGAAPGTT